MKIKALQGTAADIYQVSEKYQRYNQKYNLNMQSKWNPEFKELDRQRKENLYNYVKNGKKGYSIYDQAYTHGCLYNIFSIDFGINESDYRLNRWEGTDFKGDHPLEQVKNDPELTHIIKKAGFTYGADDVGIAELDRRWIYSHWYDSEKQDSFPIVFSDESSEYNNITKPTILPDGTRVIPSSINKAIVITVEMDLNKLKYAPTLLAFGESCQAYTKLISTILSMTGFIRSLGFEAIPSINCTALNVPLAIDAGLGQMGRNGRLIHPKFGTKVRLAKILTNLPLEADKPIDFGVTEFCDTCKKCAKKCPADAISDRGRTDQAIDEIGNPHYLRWQINHKQCYSYWTKCGTNCNICIYVCPYNRGYKWTGKAMRHSAGKSEMISQILNGIEDISDVDYTELDSSKFWAREK